MPKVHELKAAKDYPDIDVKKGETYYKWSIKLQRGGIVRKSKTYPRPSQLTVSDFWVAYYSAREAFEDALAGADSFASLEDARSDFASELETIRDEQDEKRNN